MAKPTQATIDEIKKQARNVVSTFGARDRLLVRYREIYFMENIERPRNGQVDEGDWKITPSPSGRNAVVGMQRLLNTSELSINIKDSDDVRGSSEIEEGLKAIMRVSGEGRRARIEGDAALSSVLYGAVTVYAESIADLLTIKTLKPYKRRLLEKKLRRSPFLIRPINIEESYPEFDEDMMISHTWKYKIRGGALRSRWGVEARDNTEYTVHDVFTPDLHVVWADGYGDIFAEEHGLGCVPVFTAYAGGSDLFKKPEYQMNSFLYAKAIGNFDKRENSLLTAIFTNIHMRGLLGPLVSINPETAPEEIVVSHTGGARWVKADAKQIDERIINPEIFQAKALLDELDGQSTIQKQTLGENMGSNVPFSSLAMLSNSGKLPLVDPQRAIEQVFTDAFNYILYRIKNDPIDNEQINPNDITDDMEVTVSLTAKLPQDSLRNAQVAQSLGDLVSEEWKHSELLQISDSDAMTKQVLKEQMKKAIFQATVNNPEIIQQAVMAIMGQGNKPPAQPDPNAQPPTDQMMQGEDMAQGADMQAMSGAMGSENMERLPMADSMIPPQENPNVR